MVSVRTLIFFSFSLFFKPLVNVPSEPHTIGITITFIFHSIFSSQISLIYLTVFSLHFNFSLWFVGYCKIYYLTNYCFLVITKSGLLAGIRWSICIWKTREFYVFHFLWRILFCAYYLRQHDQILILCTIPSRSPFLPSQAYSFIYLVITCFIHYTFYYVVHFQFSI